MEIEIQLLLVLEILSIMDVISKKIWTGFSYCEMLPMNFF